MEKCLKCGFPKFINEKCINCEPMSVGEAAFLAGKSSALKYQMLKTCSVCKKQYHEVTKNNRFICSSCRYNMHS